ncbi:MAG: ThuA domain-containing protein [Sphingobacteriales bacterium]|nr:MAG: ThuA domain-containing protein [Sphingobacteriales bacterium]
MNCLKKLGLVLASLCFFMLHTNGQVKPFKVIGFYTGINDPAHVSFVHEANQWLSKTAVEQGFQYDSTNDWSKLNQHFLAQYQLVLFLDTRPEVPAQRMAFEQYMKDGGAWIGFHFAAFALTPSGVEQNWDWYHNSFLGSGEYKSNTWRPTAATLKVDLHSSAFTKGLPRTFVSAPNEWYCWKKDLRKDKNIQVLLSIDSSSFPVGTGPKPHEIWHSGDYPVAWTNKKYRMVYINMGHNDMDYGGTDQALSSSFSSEWQNRFLLNSILSFRKNK